MSGGGTMSDPKPFASLSPSLLARKGAAKPAMRPQSFRFANEAQTSGLAHAQFDDLGWNDMGDDRTAAVTPSAAPVSLHNAPIATLAIPPRIVAQQEALAQTFASPISKPEQRVPAFETVVKAKPGAPASTAAVPLARAASGGKPKAAFTLRLEPERHLRLRLVCAVNHRSAQQIVTQALDEFLARQPENSRLASLG